jgi:hypothetical protein
MSGKLEPDAVVSSTRLYDIASQEAIMCYMILLPIEPLFVVLISVFFSVNFTINFSASYIK